MGKLHNRHFVELGLWLAFAALAYAVSYQFDRPIEIYEYGATTWPRAVLLLIVFAALGQLAWQWRYGDEDEGHLVRASSEETEPSGEGRVAYFLRMGGILLVPVLYAAFMNDIGFYVLTPFFIAAVIFLMGERRWLLILFVTVVVYVAVLICFTVLLYTGLPLGNLHPFYDISNWILEVLQ